MVLNRQRHFLKMKRKRKNIYIYIIYINKKFSTTGIGLSELKSKVYFFMGLLLFLKNSRYDYYDSWLIIRSFLYRVMLTSVLWVMVKNSS